ncbi:unnamed protein product [Citrullus colocynthis]|uniref:Uncharacterized protein n=1 Tax=Citrullus colocynthis TaxID=252529 RepID=A0ABP0YRA1_9ROSI
MSAFCIGTFSLSPSLAFLTFAVSQSPLLSTSSPPSPSFLLRWKNLTSDLFAEPSVWNNNKEPSIFWVLFADILGAMDFQKNWSTSAFA